MSETTLYPSTWPAYIWFSLVVGIPAVTFLYDFVKWFRMPPGPIPLPFIGNKLQLPRSKPWVQFQEWSKTYGPIYTIWIGRRPTIILSDTVVASELLEKRSSKYSSRPRMVAVSVQIFSCLSLSRNRSSSVEAALRSSTFSL